VLVRRKPARAAGGHTDVAVRDHAVAVKIEALDFVVPPTSKTCVPAGLWRGRFEMYGAFRCQGAGFEGSWLDVRTMVEGWHRASGAEDRGRYRAGGRVWWSRACWARGPVVGRLTVGGAISHSPHARRRRTGNAGWGTIDGRDGRRQISRRFNSCEKSLSLTVFCTSTP
jgi:hypothetical protein